MDNFDAYSMIIDYFGPRAKSQNFLQYLARLNSNYKKYNDKYIRKIYGVYRDSSAIGGHITRLQVSEAPN